MEEKNEKNPVDIPFILMDSIMDSFDKKILNNISGQLEHSPLETHPCRMKDVLNKSELPKHLKKLPLAISVSKNSEMDWRNAFKQLEMLEESSHFGPVCILTDSKIGKEIAGRLGLFRLRKIVIYNIDSEKMDKEVVVNSVENLVLERVPLLINLKTSEIKDNNLENLLKELSNLGAKYFSCPDREELFEHLPERNNVFLFRNLSCGITNALGLSYDYNVKFSYPEKARCVECVNFQKCTSYASNWENDESINEIIKKIGIKAEIKHVNGKEDSNSCKIYKRCNNICSDCILNKGTKLVIKGSYSKKFLNILKWLTGIEVEPTDELTGLNLTDKEINKLEDF